MESEVFRRPLFVLGTVLIQFLFPLWALAASIPEKETSLPSIQLRAPAIEKDRKYLGVEEGDFELKEIDFQVLLVEIIGVYCPRCYDQAPLFNRLYDRIEKRKLNDRVKMIGIAAGGTATEVKHLREVSQYRYPVVQDESFAVHKLLGEPRTPFTMLVNKEGKVLYSHLGVIEDADAFYEQIKALVK